MVEKGIVAMRYPFDFVHFPKRDYPEKLTQRETISKKELSEHSILSKQKATRSYKIEKDNSLNAQPIRKSRMTEYLS